MYGYTPNPIEWVDPFGLNPRASKAIRHGPSVPRKVNNRFPINSCFAGKTMTMRDINEAMLKRYPNLLSKYPHGVPFNMMGFPDFSRYAIRSVNIPNGFISDNKDFTEANKLAFGGNNRYKNSGNIRG